MVIVLVSGSVAYKLDTGRNLAEYLAESRLCPSCWAGKRTKYYVVIDESIGGDTSECLSQIGFVANDCRKRQCEVIEIAIVI